MCSAWQSDHLLFIRSHIAQAHVRSYRYVYAILTVPTMIDWRQGSGLVLGPGSLHRGGHNKETRRHASLNDGTPTQRLRGLSCRTASWSIWSAR